MKKSNIRNGGSIKGKKLVGYKWVFTIKYKADKKTKRYKVRMVVKGYAHIYGLNYQQIFALVA